MPNYVSLEEAIDLMCRFCFLDEHEPGLRKAIDAVKSLPIVTIKGVHCIDRYAALNAIFPYRNNRINDPGILRSEAALKALLTVSNDTSDTNKVESTTENTNVSAVTVGEWIYDDIEECYLCSECGAAALNNYRGLSVASNGCPNCVTKMVVKKNSNWIDPNKRKPAIDEDVIVFTDYGFRGIGRYTKYGLWQIADHSSPEERVLRWQPMPEKNKEN